MTGSGAFGLALAAVGFALALGRYNPIYLLLAEAPGFNLFRVPARFLALFSLAMALLAGMGVEALSQPIRRWRPLVLISGAIALLIGVTYAMLPGDPRLIFGGATISDGSLALLDRRLAAVDRPASDWPTLDEAGRRDTADG